MNPYTYLTTDQQRLCDQVLDVAGVDGSDSKDVLDNLDAPALDKAAVAEALGGPGAGDEYLPNTDTTPAAASDTDGQDDVADEERPRTADQARQDVADMASMSPSARRTMFRMLAHGNREASPEAAAVYHHAAGQAEQEADRALAQDFTDRVSHRGPASAQTPTQHTVHNDDDTDGM